MTPEPAVCWGRRHTFKAERSEHGGMVTLSEFLDEDATAFRRCYNPTAAELQAWLIHAYQAGQDYEVRQQDDLPAEPVPCPTCPENTECACSDAVKEARRRFAPGGEGAISRSPVGTTNVYPGLVTPPGRAAQNGTS